MRPAVDYTRRPMLVFWETTRACPLACKHCRASATPNALPGELDTSEGLALIDQVARFGRPYPILVFTGGDCLARPDIFELTARATQLGIPVAMSPSVSPALTEDIIARIADSGVKAVSLSLDGARPATHDGIRGIDGHLAATLQAIENFVEAGLRVQVNTTVMRANVRELGEIAAQLVRVKAHIWEVFFLVHVGRGAATGAVSADECEQVCHFLYDASTYPLVVRTVEAPFFRRVVLQRRAGISAPRAPLYRELAAQLNDLIGPPAGVASAQTAATRDGKGIIFVAHNGVVFPAGFLPLELGNVRDRSLADIYREDALLQRIRSSAFAGRCGRCEYADLCGGSRARAFASTGDPLESDPACVYQPPAPAVAN